MPTVLKVIQARELGTSYLPAPYKVDIPPGSTYCVVMWNLFGNGGYPTYQVQANFAALSPIQELVTSTTPLKTNVGIVHGPVNNRTRGAIQFIWGWSSISGPLPYIVFLRDVDLSNPVRDIQLAMNGFELAANVTIDTEPTDLLLVGDFTGTTPPITPIPPIEPAGWTTPTMGIGNNVNSIAGRLRYANTPGSPTTDVTAETLVNSFPALAAISLRHGPNPPVRYGLEVYNSAGAVTVTDDDFLARFHTVIDTGVLPASSSTFFSVPGYRLDGRWFIFPHIANYIIYEEAVDGIWVHNQLTGVYGPFSIIVFRT